MSERKTRLKRVDNPNYVRVSIKGKDTRAQFYYIKKDNLAKYKKDKKAEGKSVKVVSKESVGVSESNSKPKKKIKIKKKVDKPVATPTQPAPAKPTRPPPPPPNFVPVYLRPTLPPKGNMEGKADTAQEVFDDLTSQEQEKIGKLDLKKVPMAVKVNIGRKRGKQVVEGIKAKGKARKEGKRAVRENIAKKAKDIKKKNVGY